MKKTVLFVLLEPYADWEIAYLSSLLIFLGQDTYSVKTVSLTKDPIRSMGGLTVLPDYSLSTVPETFEGLVLIGGMGWRSDAARQVERLVQKAVQRGNALGGICDASAFLGTLGVLNSVKHTSNDLNDLKQWAGTAYTGEHNYLSQPAVRDGSIITANGTAALEFAKEVLLALDAAPEDTVTQWYDFYRRGRYEAPTPGM